MKIPGSKMDELLVPAHFNFFELNTSDYVAKR